MLMLNRLLSTDYKDVVSSFCLFKMKIPFQNDNLFIFSLLKSRKKRKAFQNRILFSKWKGVSDGKKVTACLYLFEC
ncbi:hypothetical protein BOVA604_2905 [Bacteroides ovatus]|nr:hypothetical protein BOVA604_2905 [Bacteroides ovatus]